MALYPRILGYLGTLPFIVLTVGLFVFHADPVATKLYAIFELCYAALIACFLSGVHWPLAIKDRDNKRLTLSVLPTILCTALLFWGFTHDPLQPLLAMAALFWVQYIVDRRYYDMLILPDGYLNFRLSLTILVSGLLILSFFAAA